jgi:hypothetical protein
MLMQPVESPLVRIASDLTPNGATRLRVIVSTIFHCALLSHVAAMSDAEFTASVDELRRHPNLAVRWTCAYRWARINLPRESADERAYAARQIWS